MNVTLSQDANQVLVKPVGTLERTLPVDMDLEAIEPTISLFQDTVEAPVKEGQVMGTMTLTYDGEVFGTLDLVATTSVDRSELLYRQEQIRQFFANSGTKLILAAVLVVAVLVLLRLLVFRKRRRYRAGAGAGGRREQLSWPAAPLTCRPIQKRGPRARLTDGIRGPFSLQELFERLGHLVGTGCGFHPAADPLHALDRLLHRHPFSRLEMPWRFPLHPPPSPVQTG